MISIKTNSPSLIVYTNDMTFNQAHYLYRIVQLPISNASWHICTPIFSSFNRNISSEKLWHEEALT